MSFHRGIFFVLLVLLPTQLGYHLWPAWTLVLGRRIDYLSPTIFFTDILIVLLLMSWCAEKKVWQHMRNWKKYTVIPVPQMQVILLGTCVVVSNIWNANNHMVALMAWVKILEYALLGWYMYRTDVRMNVILAPLAIGVIYSSLIGIVQFVLQHSIGGFFWFLGERTFSLDTPGIARITLCNPLSFSCITSLRAYATFPHSNVLGGYLAVLLPLILVQLLVNKSPRNYLIVYQGAFISGIAGLLTTFSRGAWVVSVAGIWYVLTTHTLSHLRFTTTRIVLQTIVAVLLLWLGFVSAPLTSESVEVRSQLNLAAIEMWKQAPLLGVGLRNFIVSLPAHISSIGVYTLQPVHNIYLLLLSETGLLGVSAVLVLLVSLAKSIRKSAKRPVTVSLCLFLLLGLFDHYPATIQQGQLLFVVLLGLLFSERKV